VGRSNNIIHPTRGKISMHQQDRLRAGDDERWKGVAWHTPRRKDAFLIWLLL
jgi:hypothetical protein